jgi:predicted dehydrogenase
MQIKLGVIGCSYGKNVIAPAFRADPRCQIVAIAASRLASAQEAAAQLEIEHAYGDWRQLIEDDGVDAIAVATPPSTQPEIVLRALECRKAVFAEKPLAASVADARKITDHLGPSQPPNMVDFNFTQISAFLRARELLQQNAVGLLRHVAVNWQTESYTNRVHIENWKSSAEQGGGALSNFVSHSLHYLEWFMGPIAGLSARLFRMAKDTRPADTSVSLAMEFRSGAAGMLSMSAAAHPGSGHRIEFYGEDGSLVLENLSRDYMRGFRLLHCRRPAATLMPVDVTDPEEGLWEDGRVLPVSRLARSFFNWIELGKPARPDFRDGLRVQELIAAAQRSHQGDGWVEIPRHGEQN